jgi:hypothetical protein
VKSGRAGRIRTDDLLTPSQARYQATLQPVPFNRGHTISMKSCKLQVVCRAGERIYSIDRAGSVRHGLARWPKA